VPLPLPPAAVPPGKILMVIKNFIMPRCGLIIKGHFCKTTDRDIYEFFAFSDIKKQANFWLTLAIARSKAKIKCFSFP